MDALVLGIEKIITTAAPHDPLSHDKFVTLDIPCNNRNTKNGPRKEFAILLIGGGLHLQK
jgi:hypothetical protein